VLQQHLGAVGTVDDEDSVAMPGPPGAGVSVAAPPEPPPEPSPEPPPSEPPTTLEPGMSDPENSSARGAATRRKPQAKEMSRNARPRPVPVPAPGAR
jgi:hypothetical protein